MSLPRSTVAAAPGPIGSTLCPQGGRYRTVTEQPEPKGESDQIICGGKAHDRRGITRYGNTPPHINNHI